MSKRSWWLKIRRTTDNLRDLLGNAGYELVETVDDEQALAAFAWQTPANPA